MALLELKLSKRKVRDFLSHRKSLTEEVKDLPVEDKKDLRILHCEEFEVEFTACFFLIENILLKAILHLRVQSLEKASFHLFLFYCH